MIEVVETSLDSAEATALLAELSDRLRAITGADGRANSANLGVFVVARIEGDAVGCGALREIEPGIGELKRMYAREPGRGIGGAILAHLERAAVALGYRELWLETRRVNTGAVAFYQRHGYVERESYGAYLGRAECVCFAKRL